MTDTRKEVFEILEEAKQNGEKVPSIRAVRNRIKKGSYTTISEAHRDWRLQQLPPPDLNKSSLTPTELQKLGDMVKSIVEVRVTAIKAQLKEDAEKRLRIEMESLEEGRTEAAESISEAERLREELAVTREELTNVRVVAASLEAVNISLQKALDEQSKKIDALQEEASRDKREIGRLEGELSAAKVSKRGADESESKKIE